MAGLTLKQAHRSRQSLLASLLVLNLAFPLWAASPSVDGELNRIVDSSSDILNGHLGYKFADADTGEIIAERNSSRFFTPASNTKLYTTALALVRLGIAYQFKTVVRSPAAPDPEGVVSSLEFIAGGDPNLSGRVLPYSPVPAQNDPLTPIRALAEQIAGLGVREVAGDIEADDTRYPYDPYPDGWTFDDGTWYYGAPVSGFSINDNSVHVRVRPTVAGDLTAVELDPEVGALLLLNEAVTVRGKESKITMQRILGSNELVVAGFIGESAQPAQEDVAVPDPSLFAGQALAAELENIGISVRGGIRVRHADAAALANTLVAARVVSEPEGLELASITSAPLPQAVGIVNKVSQNLHAEMLLREVASASRNVGTLAAGLEEMKVFLTEAGIPENNYSFSDGSGLARADLTTPASTVALLRYMWARPERQAWFDSLPVGGLDGSLKHRFHGISGAERVHAKTGSLSHVAALSGYLQTKGGRWIAFSLMANSEMADAATVQRFFDSICGVFLNQ